jgi:hypothetical protein
MRRLRVVGVLFALFHLGVARADDADRVGFERAPGQLRITVGGKDFATYVYHDPVITRPYFAHVRAPGGVQVTRRHPPVEGQDPTDHATFHPGVWLAFGDLSGADGWRLRARVDHERFVGEPEGGSGRGTFTVANHYRDADGRSTICREVCRYTVVARPSGTLLVISAEFRSDDREFSFGDQEEMGLGVRLATPLSVKQRGKMTDSAGRSGEKQIRGQSADWCDGSGTVGGADAGLAVFTDPTHFRAGWFHARDYGLIVANPFGAHALTGGPESKVVVKPGTPFRLAFGVYAHSGPDPDLAEAYRAFREEVGKDGPR